MNGPLPAEPIIRENTAYELTTVTHQHDTMAIKLKSEIVSQGELIANNIGNSRRNCSVLFTKCPTSKHLIPAMLTVSDQIQIPSKTKHR